MGKLYNKSDERIDKLEAVRRKYKHKCKCGWFIVIYPFEKKTKKLCTHCGNYVYIDKQEEFKDKLKGKMK